MSTTSKTTSPQKLFPSDCIPLYLNAYILIKTVYVCILYHCFHLSAVNNEKLIINSVPPSMAELQCFIQTLPPARVFNGIRQFYIVHTGICKRVSPHVRYTGIPGCFSGIAVFRTAFKNSKKSPEKNHIQQKLEKTLFKGTRKIQT